MRSFLQLIIDLYIMSKITIERPFEWCNQSNINIYIDDQKVGELNGGKRAAPMELKSKYTVICLLLAQVL